MRKLNVTVVEFTTEQMTELVASDKISKSDKVRQLFDHGLEVKAIAEILNIRYNFVYNVLQNYIIMNDIATVSENREVKRDDIVKLLQEGKKLVEVCRATKTNYNYVWKISKELKAAAGAENKAEVK